MKGKGGRKKEGEMRQEEKEGKKKLSNEKRKRHGKRKKVIVCDVDSICNFWYILTNLEEISYIQPQNQNQLFLL